MHKSKYGYCPIQNKDYRISIDYLDASTLTQSRFIKGRYSCDFNRFGNKCSGTCPIYEEAPDTL